MSGSIRYPTIFLVTDELPSVHSMGVTKTLFNLLKGYPKERLLIFCTPGEIKPEKGRLDGIKVIETLDYLSPVSLGRFSTYLNQVLEKLNAFIRNRIPLKPLPGNIPHPELILLATTHKSRVFLAARYAETLQIPILPYFLDFWMQGPDEFYAGHSLHQTIRHILGNARAWMVISENLKLKLEEKFNLKSPPSLVIHSPAMNIGPVIRCTTNKNITIAYAGSLWAMHFDAVALAANALEQLRQMGFQARFIIYTSEKQWQYRSRYLEEWKVEKGGFLLEDALHAELRKADFLLLAASFSKEMAHYSESSLQTKVTEYMASGVPILSVGPTYGECNRFFREHDCALVFDTINAEHLAQELKEWLANPEKRMLIAEKARRLASSFYSQSETQNRMVEFFNALLGTTDVKSIIDNGA